MPTYEEALAADPAAFVEYASQMEASGADLSDHRSSYSATVADINAEWQGKSNEAFNQDVDLVGIHVDDVVDRVGEAAGVLDAGGAQMASLVQQLKGLDAAYRGAGFTVQPAPKVELGAVHWAAIAAAGPFGPMLQALFQARADEGTVQLQTGLIALTMTDVVTGVSLASAAEALQPIEDKGEPGAEDDLGEHEMERTERTTEIDPKADRTGKKADEEDQEKKKEDEKDKDKDEKDEDEKDEDEKEDEEKKEEEEDRKDQDEPGQVEPAPPRDEDPATPPPFD